MISGKPAENKNNTSAQTGNKDGIITLAHSFRPANAPFVDSIGNIKINNINVMVREDAKEVVIKCFFIFFSPVNYMPIYVSIIFNPKTYFFLGGLYEKKYIR